MLKYGYFSHNHRYIHKAHVQGWGGDRLATGLPGNIRVFMTPQVVCVCVHVQVHMPVCSSGLMVRDNIQQVLLLFP